MKQAGVSDYESYAKKLIEAFPDIPISFEVIADDMDEMAQEAKHIATWGKNVYVKVPILNAQGESTTL